jgi:hypothetical protein
MTPWSQYTRAQRKPSLVKEKKGFRMLDTGSWVFEARHGIVDSGWWKPDLS